MSSTHIEDLDRDIFDSKTEIETVMDRIATSSKASLDKYMPIKLAQAIASPLFPELDSLLRSGRHIGIDELDNHAFLMDFQRELELFYQRYNVELIRAPEGFFYLRPRSTTLIPRSVLSELDMLVGKVLCYLYLSPERLAHEGVFTLQDLFDELISLTDENKLLKLVNQRSTGSDLDRQKLFDKVKTAVNRLRRLGMLYFIVGTEGQFNSRAENYRFRINEAIFRFGADVRSSDDAKEAQLRLIRDGEAIKIESNLDDSVDAQEDANEEIE
ncbi:chromosome partition protein MukE [Orbaceae bacterium ESL0721]|nr:chromosome partition protein MukE [Orbaceae bacterium ESL0721]